MSLVDDASYASVSCEPGAPVPVVVSFPLALTGRVGFVLGHDVINWDASVYTEFKSSGV